MLLGVARVCCGYHDCVCEDFTLVTEKLLSEIADGQGESLTQLARRIPSFRSGKPATLGRLWRWVLSGKTGPAGHRVYLEAVKTPGGWISTPRAVARFFAALTP